ncbi:hypothetical protein AA0481_1355 [Acetobacter orientalis NRIC 0481]|uniref:Uncharacterized protein n=1 Tax=Acetobacter orientalis TaxID=146474 RepID=A0A0D6NK71_9PROT|nr:hypothetical protein Abor_014_163 [Acetobacter orientalis]GBR17411.1 hypothetical protein AA0481_1355 [Acetobacter orientalis NRIC 0481]GEL60329.1 hypothetical protein AOR02nite_01710 [Acetobacter orientalis]
MMAGQSSGFCRSHHLSIKLIRPDRNILMYEAQKTDGFAINFVGYGKIISVCMEHARSDTNSDTTACMREQKLHYTL